MKAMQSHNFLKKKFILHTDCLSKTTLRPNKITKRITQSEKKIDS